MSRIKVLHQSLVERHADYIIDEYDGVINRRNAGDCVVEYLRVNKLGVSARTMKDAVLAKLDADDEEELPEIMERWK